MRNKSAHNILTRNELRKYYLVILPRSRKKSILQKIPAFFYVVMENGSRCFLMRVFFNEREGSCGVAKKGSFFCYTGGPRSPKTAEIKLNLAFAKFIILAPRFPQSSSASIVKYYYNRTAHKCQGNIKVLLKQIAKSTCL